MLKTKETAKKSNGAITVLTIIAAILASSAIYVLIVKYLMVKVFHARVLNDDGYIADGGYTVTFGELLVLNLVIIVIGYLLFLLLQWIMKFKSLVSRIILAGLCMPAVWIGLLYTAFGVNWQSPITYVYLVLLFTSGASIIYISTYFTRILQARK